MGTSSVWFAVCVGLCVGGGVAAPVGEMCASIDSKDMCLVSVEDDVSCAWCGASHGAGSCAAYSEALRREDCDFGEDTVLTRVPEMPALGAEHIREPSEDYIPVVMMHGIGDSGSNPGMKSLAKSVSDMYPGLYSVSVNVANGLSGYTTDISKQVDEFAETVRNDAHLAKGFHAVGLSQGGLIVRIYAQKYNNPPVITLMSLCGPQEGIGNCPGGTPTFLCNLVRELMYEAPVSFAGYWKNALDKEGYLKDNKYLADWNNEKSTKDSSYVQNMVSVTKYVLVQALNDTTVEPHVSEDHAFYEWGSLDKTTTFTTTEGYEGDWLGLQTLDQSGKVDHHSYIGNHLRWSHDFWTHTVLPYFNTTFESFSGLAPNQ